MKPLLPVVLVLLVAASACSVLQGDMDVSSAPSDLPRTDEVVLILVDGLTWEEVGSTPRLAGFFDGGAAANLSTAQGPTPEDPRFGYLFVGAGARVDGLALPEELPESRSALPASFTGASATVAAGSLGAALEDEGMVAVSVGDRARLVTMTPDGETGAHYDGSRPGPQTLDALDDGARLVVVDADRDGSTTVIEELRRSRYEDATVIVTSPNAPADEPPLAPISLSSSDGELYSPTTRTDGLVSNADIAPTILALLGAGNRYAFQGRAMESAIGSASSARDLGERMELVYESRYLVWAMVVGALAVVSIAGIAARGKRFVVIPVLAVASLPAASLAAALIPTTSAILVAATTLVLSVGFGFAAARLLRPGSAFVLVLSVVAAVAVLDAAFGGVLGRTAMIGYNPVYGARFYGLGNEVSAVLAGSLTVGLGFVFRSRAIPLAPVIVVLSAVVVAVALPTMGADVGGALALGFGGGLTLGLVRTRSPFGVVAWTLGGSVLAAAVVFASGLVQPDTSHGSRAVSSAASGAESDLIGTAQRKLLMSAEVASVLPLYALLAALLVFVFVGWRASRGTAVGAGIVGATATAIVSGLINDTGLVATMIVLIYPALASVLILIVPVDRLLDVQSVRRRVK